jgi:hypothetical protein
MKNNTMADLQCLNFWSLQPRHPPLHHEQYVSPMIPPLSRIKLLQRPHRGRTRNIDLLE